ncbi:hypothetical protein G6F22_021571 [Rhizopus arrhizus]|nr:hypothetical protein G6F22_021571 [Rhizopus arrhizus]
MDADKDGKISRKEAAVVPEIEKYFAGLDTDGDGYLSLKEMQQAMVAAQTADAPAKCPPWWARLRHHARAPERPAEWASSG